jgi:predicted nucleotide-binding protein
MNADEARGLLLSAGLTVKTESLLPNGTGHQIRLTNGSIVNIFNNGNVSVQGKNRSQVETILASTISTPTSTAAATALAAKKVFVVHGHDTPAREQLELVLHRLHLDPFVLANTAGGGLTIIEALEKEIGTSSGARFGIALMTPDDVGYSRLDGPDKGQPRARQNVVLEMGMLIAAVGRSRVAILKKGALEVPSDAQGILYIPFSDHVRETVPKLVDRLQAAGFSLAAGDIAKAAS